MRYPVIAIDGPAGSGKSSVSKGAATRMGMRYLDTGAMYRAMTWAMLDAGIDVNDAEAVARGAAEADIVSGTDPAAPTITANGVDVAEPIRGEAVTAAVSAVSAVGPVRERLVQLQRDAVQEALRNGVGIVVEGRDITTVVLPDADVKVYITADPEVRARRRALQDGDGAAAADVARTQDALVARDAKDSGRAVSPLTVAPDAVVLDTTDLTLDQAIDEVCVLAAARSK